MEIGKINWYTEPVNPNSVTVIEHEPVEIPAEVFDAVSKVQMPLEYAKDKVRSTPLLEDADFDALVAMFLLRMEDQIKQTKIKRALNGD